MRSRFVHVALAAITVCSCADVWGFEDATERGGSDASPGSKHDAGGGDGMAADSSLDGVPVLLEDAPRPDGGGPPADATSPLDASQDAIAMPLPAVVCDPPCPPGAACLAAVGNVPVCVTAATCTDSTSCGSPCCVWLDSSSATGRCLASPGPPDVSCLCTSGTPRMGQCKACDRSLVYPLAPVEVCSDGS